MTSQGNAAAPTPAIQDPGKEQQLIDQLVDTVIDAGPESAPGIVAARLAELENSGASVQLAVLSGVLKGFLKFFQALRLMQTDIAGAHQLFNETAQQFGGLAQVELRELSLGFGSNTNAIIQAQKANIALAVELFAEARKHVQAGGRFGQQFELLIDSTALNGLFVSALQAMMSLDYA